MRKLILAMSVISLLQVAWQAPALAQRSKQWAADWTRCVSHNSSENRWYNQCNENMEVYWVDTGGHKNQVTVRANSYHTGGERPDDYRAYLANNINYFDWEAMRCWYWG